MVEVSSERFFKTINSITSSNGGIKLDQTDQFAQICSEVNNIKQKGILLTIILNSNEQIQLTVHQKGFLSTLKDWLNDPSVSDQFVVDVLTYLQSCSFDAALIKNSQIGKNIKQLCTHEQQAIKFNSIKVRDYWKLKLQENLKGNLKSNFQGQQQQHKVNQPVTNLQSVPQIQDLKISKDQPKQPSQELDIQEIQTNAANQNTLSPNLQSLASINYDQLTPTSRDRVDCQLGKSKIKQRLVIKTTNLNKNKSSTPDKIEAELPNNNQNENLKPKPPVDIQAQNQPNTGSFDDSKAQVYSIEPQFKGAQVQKDAVEPQKQKSGQIQLEGLEGQKQGQEPDNQSLVLQRQTEAINKLKEQFESGKNSQQWSKAKQNAVTNEPENNKTDSKARDQLDQQISQDQNNNKLSTDLANMEVDVKEGQTIQAPEGSKQQEGPQKDGDKSEQDRQLKPTSEEPVRTSSDLQKQDEASLQNIQGDKLQQNQQVSKQQEGQVTQNMQSTDVKPSLEQQNSNVNKVVDIKNQQKQNNNMRQKSMQIIEDLKKKRSSNEKEATKQKSDNKERAQNKSKDLKNQESKQKLAAQQKSVQIQEQKIKTDLSSLKQQNSSRDNTINNNQAKQTDIENKAQVLKPKDNLPQDKVDINQQKVQSIKDQDNLTISKKNQDKLTNSKNDTSLAGTGQLGKGKQTSTQDQLKKTLLPFGKTYQFKQNSAFPKIQDPHSTKNTVAGSKDAQDQQQKQAGGKSWTPFGTILFNKKEQAATDKSKGGGNQSQQQQIQVEQPNKLTDSKNQTQPKKITDSKKSTPLGDSNDIIDGAKVKDGIQVKQEGQGRDKGMDVEMKSQPPDTSALDSGQAPQTVNQKQAPIKMEVDNSIGNNDTQQRQNNQHDQGNLEPQVNQQSQDKKIKQESVPVNINKHIKDQNKKQQQVQELQKPTDHSQKQQQNNSVKEPNPVQQIKHQQTGSQNNSVHKGQLYSSILILEVNIENSIKLKQAVTEEFQRFNEFISQHQNISHNKSPYINESLDPPGDYSNRATLAIPYDPPPFDLQQALQSPEIVAVIKNGQSQKQGEQEILNQVLLEIQLSILQRHSIPQTSQQDQGLQYSTQPYAPQNQYQQMQQSQIQQQQLPMKPHQQHPLQQLNQYNTPLYPNQQWGPQPQTQQQQYPPGYLQYPGAQPHLQSYPQYGDYYSTPSTLNYQDLRPYKKLKTENQIEDGCEKVYLILNENLTQVLSQQLPQVDYFSMGEQKYQNVAQPNIFLIPALNERRLTLQLPIKFDSEPQMLEHIKNQIQ